ncbi:MAG: 2-hydroxychromene-2-carboxylate isomerase [Hyphomicrobiaceae bacterium]
MAVVTYYLSLNSPWSYLGSRRLIEMTRRLGVPVDVKPAKYGVVFAETGGLPLAKRPPARRAYRMMDLSRWRDHLAIPIVLEPRHFPSDETAGTRLVIATARAGQDALTLSSEIGRALWEREENIADPAVLVAAAARAGIDVDKVSATAPSDAELDAIWDANTTEAVSRGVFGAPSYVLASGEIFWGQDRLDFLERALQREQAGS